MNLLHFLAESTTGQMAAFPIGTRLKMAIISIGCAIIIAGMENPLEFHWPQVAYQIQRLTEERPL
jgi:hypothetical protein